VFVHCGHRVQCLCGRDRHLYVFIGALLRLRNEAELAAVLGTRVATCWATTCTSGLSSPSRSRESAQHSPWVSRRRSRIRRSRQLLDDGGVLRDFERDADDIGFQRLTAAGYEPKAAASVFDRLPRGGRSQDQTGAVLFRRPPEASRARPPFSDARSGLPGRDLRTVNSSPRRKRRALPLLKRSMSTETERS